MKEKKKNKKESQQSSIIDICIRLKDMTLAVPNSEYWIEFSVIDQNGSSSRCRLHNNSLSKISNGKLLIAQID
ncbi:MAG: hypothetical protein M3299_17480 [Thermoproteota archaeon]|nr:hypothetical protein [Thermoproteota archaeon]